MFAARMTGWSQGSKRWPSYALDGVPKHAARQLPNGRWTSKCGELEDIEHALEGVVGIWYGTVAHLLKRPLASQERAAEESGEAAD